MEPETPESKEWAEKRLAETLFLEEQGRLAEESPPEELAEIFRLIDYDVFPILDASGVAITREELTKMFAEWFVRTRAAAAGRSQGGRENVELPVGEPRLASSSSAGRILSGLLRSGGPLRRSLRSAGIVIMLAPLVLLPAYFFVSTQLPPPEAGGVLTVAPPLLLIAPGQTQNYTVLTLTRPASGSTLPITLSASSPAGLSFAITMTYLPVQPVTSIPVVIHASESVAPGAYKVTVQEREGSSVGYQTFAVKVVPALVVMERLAFVPQQLSVPKGTTVYWINLDSTIGCCDPGIHNVDFTAGQSLLSPDFGTYGVWSFKFDQTGDFYYICSIHPYMTGEVRVTA